VTDLSTRPWQLLYRLALRENELDFKAKLAGYVLETYFNAETRRWAPSIESLVRGTGMSESSVQRAVRELVRADLLEVEERAGRHGTNVYVARLTPVRLQPVYDFHAEATRKRGQLTLDEGRLATAPAGVSEGHPTSQRDTAGVSEGHLGGVSVTPELELELEQGLERQLQTPTSAAGVEERERPHYPSSIEPYVRLADEISDADEGTPFVLANVGRGWATEAVLARALEALRERRRHPKRSPLVSEAAYVVGTLKDMREEHAA
jgi:hypothetical protein